MDFDDDWEALRESSYPDFVGERGPYGEGHVFSIQDGIKTEIPPPEFGFDWGKPSMGATYLTTVILQRVLGPGKVSELHGIFRLVVHGLPENSWRITRKDVLEALDGLI
jgi:hypothetical protein